MHNVRTALVVEEEFLIALDIQRMLENRDVAHTVFARSAAEALLQQPSWGELCMAIVEVREGNADSIALCRKLLALDVPVIVATGDTRLRHGVPELAGTPVMVKPISEKDVTSAWSVALALGARSE